MQKNKKIFKIDAGKLFAVSLILLALTTAFSCSSPLIGKSQNSKADFTLNFIISGSSRDAVTKSLAEKEATSSGNEAQSASRLILTTAKTLSVTLTPKKPGGTVLTQTVIIDSAAMLPVPFESVPYGAYTIKADAFAEDKTTILFTQTSEFELKSSSATVILNLVPANPDNIPLLTDVTIIPTLINRDTAYSWLLPKGSPLLSSRNILFTTNIPELLIYVQDSNGKLIMNLPGTNSISTSLIPKDQDIYLTLHNTSSENASISFCVSPELVTVPAGAFQRDGTASTNISYVSEFSLGKYEVTQAQYLAIMGENPSSNTTSVSIPVDCINFYRAITFCNKLSLLEGLTAVYSVLDSNGNQISWASIAHGDIPTVSNDYWNAVSMDLSANGYRLPTEMEWRWAAMGATMDRANGNSGTGINKTGYSKAYAGSTEPGSTQVNIGNYAWCQSNSDLDGAGPGGNSSQPVGTKLQNELGIYDMSGNVWEWCWDLYEVNYPTGSVSNYLGATAISRSNDMTSMFVGASYADTTFQLNDRGAIMRKPQDGPDAVGFRVARGSLYLENGLHGEWLFNNNTNDTSLINSSITSSSYFFVNDRRDIANAAINTPVESIITAAATGLIVGPSDPFTISLWINPKTIPTGSGSQYYIIRQNGDSIYQFQYWVALDNSGNLMIFIAQYYYPAMVGVCTTSIELDKWSHIAFSWTPAVNLGTLQVWKNGIAELPVNNVNTTGFIKYGGARIQLGGGYNVTAGPSQYDGGIDDLRIYNRVLTASEIQALYAE